MPSCRPVSLSIRSGAAALAVLMLAGVAGSAGYSVRPGDNLTRIAERHDTTVSALAEANGLEPPFKVVVGQELALPESAASDTSEGHRVNPGETLWGLAARYGISVQGLAAANGLAPEQPIFVGQELALPDHARGVREHVVAPGETLLGLAARYGIGSRVIARANGVRGSRIYAGQTLVIPSEDPPELRASAAGPPARSLLPERAAIGDEIERVAREYNWSPALVKALAWQESGWQTDVVSSAGAVGPMQVLPSTGEFVSRHLVGRELDLDDPTDNIVAGVAFLDYLYQLTGGDTELVVGGYYQGLRSIQDNGMFPDTRRYIDSVLVLRERFR